MAMENMSPKEKRKIIKELRRKLQQPPTALPKLYLLDNNQKYEMCEGIIPNGKKFQICYFKNNAGEKIAYKSTDLNINYNTGECIVKSEKEILEYQLRELKKERGELESKIHNITINKDNYYDWRDEQRNLMKT